MIIIHLDKNRRSFKIAKAFTPSKAASNKWSRERPIEEMLNKCIRSDIQRTGNHVAYSISLMTLSRLLSSFRPLSPTYMLHDDLQPLVSTFFGGLRFHSISKPRMLAEL